MKISYLPAINNLKPTSYIRTSYQQLPAISVPAINNLKPTSYQLYPYQLSTISNLPAISVPAINNLKPTSYIRTKPTSYQQSQYQLSTISNLPGCQNFQRKQRRNTRSLQEDLDNVSTPRAKAEVSTTPKKAVPLTPRRTVHSCKS